MAKNNPYCYAPWTTAQYGGTYHGGGISPCCEWKGETFTGAVKDYQDSNFLKDIKTAMEKHDMSVISNTCAECIQNEKLGNNSARNYIERDINTSNIALLKEFSPDAGSCVLTHHQTASKVLFLKQLASYSSTSSRLYLT